jgi:hypothetical protein
MANRAWKTVASLYDIERKGGPKVTEASIRVHLAGCADKSVVDDCAHEPHRRAMMPVVRERNEKAAKKYRAIDARRKDRSYATAPARVMVSDSGGSLIGVALAMAASAIHRRSGRKS